MMTSVLCLPQSTVAVDSNGHDVARLQRENQVHPQKLFFNSFFLESSNVSGRSRDRCYDF
jgi:hypothetical protein